MEGIGSETYHFKENNDEAKSDKYRGQTNTKKRAKLENKKKANEAKTLTEKKKRSKLNTQHKSEVNIQGESFGLTERCASLKCLAHTSTHRIFSRPMAS